MPKDTEYYKFIVEEVLGDIPGIHSRSMFGGWGIYKDGIFFALLFDGQLYFKVDESSRKDYEDLGSEPFVYQGKQKPITLSYWILPEDIMSDKEKLREWIDKSIAASIRSKKKK